MVVSSDKNLNNIHRNIKQATETVYLWHHWQLQWDWRRKSFRQEKEQKLIGSYIGHKNSFPWRWWIFSCFCLLFLLRSSSNLLKSLWLKNAPKLYILSYIYIYIYLHIILCQKYKLWCPYVIIFGQTEIFDFTTCICMDFVQFNLETIL